MDDHELETLLKGNESDRVERKPSIAQADEIRRVICAFANDLPDHRQPGVLFIGVENDGTCARLSITDQLLQTLSDWRSNGNILPFPTMTVEKRVIAGCEMAIVAVDPSLSPPVRYRGRVYVRVGPTTRVATREEEIRLSEKRRAGDLPFDLRAVSGATISDLDLELFRREYLSSVYQDGLLARNERDVEEQLASVRFATAPPESVPTVVGMLVVGNDPRDFIPAAYVQFLRIDGVGFTDPIKDQDAIDGPLLHLLRRLDEKMRVHITVASDPTAQPVEVRHADYPIVALQQLAWNAVLHRTYEGTNAPVRVTWFSDRIEMQSPGGPFGQVNERNFGRPGITDYRNPNLAEVMRNLGYVQRFGIGIKLARKELEKNGNPPLEFVVGESYVLVTVRKRS